MSEHAAQSESNDVDEGSAFLAALVQAMQAVAGAERTKVFADIERRRSAHIAVINARRDAEANRMRELADEDRKAIVTWAAAERLRIQLERERRARMVDQDLETSLAEHGAKIAREIDGSVAAIATHRADVDAFFATIEHETDPVAIARHAVGRPIFPTFETHVQADVGTSPEIPEPEAPAVLAAVAAASPGVPEPEAPAIEAPAVLAAVDAATPVAAPEPEAPAIEAPAVLAAVDAATPVAAPEPVAAAVAVAAVTGASEAPAVAVMDPIAVKRAEWWARWKDLHEPPELAEVLDSVEQTAPSVELLDAVTVGASDATASNGPSGVLLQSIPILRPMDWLRRGRDSGRGANEER